MVLTNGLQFPRMLERAVKEMDHPIPHGHHLATALLHVLPTQASLLTDPSLMEVRVSITTVVVELAQAPALAPQQLLQVVGIATEVGLAQTTQLLQLLLVAILPTPTLAATAITAQAPEARAAAPVPQSRPSLVQLALSMCHHSPC